MIFVANNYAECVLEYLFLKFEDLTTDAKEKLKFLILWFFKNIFSNFLKTDNFSIFQIKYLHRWFFV